jgi:uncharacterized membrane protein
LFFNLSYKFRISLVHHWATVQNIQMNLTALNLLEWGVRSQAYIYTISYLTKFILEHFEVRNSHIIIIIIIGISFMQGIYTYIPETNHVPREHCVATILM